MRSARALASLVVVIPLGVAACGGDDGATLTVYSGRSEELIAPVVDRFTKETGIDVEVLYSDSGDLARQIEQEGDDSPADLFFSQAPGPLGFLDDLDAFAPLPQALLELVPKEYESSSGDWVGISGRVRVLVFDPESTPESSLPASVLDLASPDFTARIGVAPTNASFQDFVSYLRIAIGDDKTLQFLNGLVENGARTYPNNLTIVEAVGRGEIDVGLVNNYYNMELRAQDSSLTTENHYFPAGDPGSLVLVSGAAVLKTADHVDEAHRFIEFMLTQSSQEYFAQETFEFPLIEGVSPAGGQAPLDDVVSVSTDLTLLGQRLGSTISMIEGSGLIA
jgi:iron(III) transport system substrate-binding protein